MAIGAAQRWYVGATAASVAVLGAGWFLLVTPQHTSTAEINDRTLVVQGSNAQAEVQIAALKVQFKDLPAIQSQVAAIRTRIPQTPNEPALIRALTAAAKQSGLTLTSVTVEPPSMIAGSASAGAAGGSQLLATPGQVNQVPVTLQVTGSFADTRLFLNKLEGLQRSMLVTGIDITRGKADGSLSSLTTAVHARVFMANPGAVATATGSTGPTIPTTSSADQAS